MTSAAVTLQPLVVQGKAFADIVLQNATCPQPKVNPPLRFDAIADGYDNIQIVIGNLSADLPFALCLNCCKICNSCLFGQFSLGEHIPNMTGNRRLVPPEQFCHLLQCKPDSLIPQADVDFCQAVFGLVDNNFSA